MITGTYVARGRAVQIRPATPNPAIFERRLNSGIYKRTSDGLEKRCPCCGEYWPADSEFFSPRRSVDGLSEECKACVAESRKSN